MSTRSLSVLTTGLTRSVRHNPWLRRSSYCLVAALITFSCGAYYKARWSTYAEFSHAIDPACMVVYCDFTLYYYKQARVIRQEATPVRKYFYSPTFALLLAPVGALSKESAQNTWTWVQAISLALLVVSSVLMLRGFPLWTHALLLFLTLISYPVLHNWKWGQANTTFMALIVLALVLLERGWMLLAALALSLVVASRYYPIVYAVSFVVRGRRRALAWLLLASALLLIAWPVLAMGSEHAWYFYTKSRASIEQAALGWVARTSTSEYLPTTIDRLARASQGESIGSRAQWVSVASAVAACNVFFAFAAVHKRVSSRAAWAFCFVALSTPLLVPTSWMHYFVYLPLVQTFTLGQLARLDGYTVLRLACFVVLWVPSAAVASVFFYLHVGDAGEYARLGYLLFSNLAQLLLAYILFAIRWSQCRLLGPGPATLRPSLG